MGHKTGPTQKTIEKIAATKVDIETGMPASRACKKNKLADATWYKYGVGPKTKPSIRTKATRRNTAYNGDSMFMNATFTPDGINVTVPRRNVETFLAKIFG